MKSKFKLRLKRERRKKRAAERAAAQPIIDGKTLIKMFDQRLDALFGQIRNPLIAGLSTKAKNKV